MECGYAAETGEYVSDEIEAAQWSDGVVRQSEIQRNLLTSNLSCS